MQKTWRTECQPYCSDWKGMRVGYSEKFLQQSAAWTCKRTHRSLQHFPGRAHPPLPLSIHLDRIPYPLQDTPKNASGSQTTFGGLLEWNPKNKFHAAGNRWQLKTSVLAREQRRQGTPFWTYSLHPHINGFEPSTYHLFVLKLLQLSKEEWILKHHHGCCTRVRATKTPWSIF